MAEKYFCNKCIAKKEKVGLVCPTEFCLKEHFGKDWAYNTDLFQPGGQCSLCGVQDDNIQVVRHPQMEMLVDSLEFISTLPVKKDRSGD